MCREALQDAKSLLARREAELTAAKQHAASADATAARLSARDGASQVISRVLTHIRVACPFSDITYGPYIWSHVTLSYACIWAFGAKPL